MSIDSYKLDNYFDAAKRQKLPLELEDIRSQLADSSHRPTSSQSPAQMQRLAAFTAYLPELAGALGVLAVMALSLTGQEEMVLSPEKNKQSQTSITSQLQLQQPLSSLSKPITKESVIEDKQFSDHPSPVHTDHRTEPTGPKNNSKEKRVFLLADGYAPPIRFVQLPVPILEKLGFHLAADGIAYHTVFSSEETNSKPTRIWVKVATGKTELGVDLPDSTLVEPTPIPKPLFITDLTGRQHLVKYRTPMEDPEKMEPGYFNQVANLLVPVLISVPGETGKHEAVFWFKPTDEFLSELPARMAKEIKSEYERIKTLNEAGRFAQKGKESVVQKSFKYFESAGAATSAYPISLFPNPARERVSLSFTLENPQQLRVALVDLNGRVLKVFAPLHTVPAGPFSEEYSLAGVTTGIYVVVIETATGQKQTQRLVIE